MREAAADERFEEAARYRNRLNSIRHLSERQAADRRAVGSVDVIGLAVDGDAAAVQVFPLRDGKMIDRYGFHLENVAGEDRQEVLEAFVIEFYGAAPSIPPQVFVPAGSSETGAIAEFLSERRGGRVDVRAPARGEKRRLVDLAVDNARLALEADTAQRSEKRARRVGRARGAPRGPEPREPAAPHRVLRRLEHPGRSPSWRPWSSSRTAARRTRTIATSRFAASTGRTTWGRCARRSRVGSPARATATSTRASVRLPNLVVVDGGKGQLAAARAAMEELDLPRVAVIALAKREEEVFVPDLPYPIALERTSPALQLLQQIRDEAHRRALRHHRQKRDTKTLETIFETLPGIGPLARRAILHHFGSVDRFLEASQEELEGVPGLPQKTRPSTPRSTRPSARGVAALVRAGVWRMPGAYGSSTAPSPSGTAACAA